LASVVSTTEASTAGTLTLYCPWNDHSASGSVRSLGLCVSINGSRNPFQMLSPL